MKRTDKVSVTIPAESLKMLLVFLRSKSTERQIYIDNSEHGNKCPNPTIDHPLHSVVYHEAQRVFEVSDPMAYKFGDESKSIKLNDNYSAEILDGKVKVGCQTFTHDAVKKLYKAIKNSKK